MAALLCNEFLCRTEWNSIEKLFWINLHKIVLLFFSSLLNRCRYSFIHVHDLYMQPFSFISSSPEVSQRRRHRELKVCLVRMALGYRVRVSEFRSPNNFFMVAELRL